MRQKSKPAAPNSLKTYFLQSKTIVVVAVALLLIIILTFYPKEIQVGKAFYTAGVGNAGIAEPSATIRAGNPFSLTVKANIGNQQTISIAFELNLPAEMNCDDVTGVDSELDWEEGAESALISSTARCVDDVITFEYATLDTEEAVSGEIEIADVSFDGMSEGSYQFNFALFEILNLEGEDLIENGANAEIIVLSAPGPATDDDDDGEPASSSGGGGGGGVGGTTCVPRWTCLSWSACGNGRQVRECIDERRCGTLAQRPALERNCTQVPEIPLTPGEVEQNLSAPPVIQKPVIVEPPVVSLWQKYTAYWVSVMALGVVVIAVVVSLLYRRRVQKSTISSASLGKKKKGK